VRPLPPQVLDVHTAEQHRRSSWNGYLRHHDGLASEVRYRARKGVLITTSDFTSDAREYVTRIEQRIVLINGTELADLLMEHGVGVTKVTSYTLKRIDTDYFDEDAD
jgi:hypothetical protein